MQALPPGGNHLARLTCYVTRFGIADTMASMSDPLIESECMAAGGEGMKAVGEGVTRGPCGLFGR